MKDSTYCVLYFHAVVYVIVDCLKMSVVHKCISCKRVLSVSCGLNLPPVLPVFF